MNKYIVEIILAFSLLFIIFPSANAEQKYIWIDENGQTYISETEPENWETQEFKETKESKQAEMQRMREEAIREEQLKAEEERKRKLETNRLTTKRKKG